MLPSGSSQAPKKQDHITPVSASRHCLVVRFRIDLYLSVKTFIVWLLISPTFYTPTLFSGASAQLIRFFWLSHTLDSHLEEIICSPCVPPNYGTAFPSHSDVLPPFSSFIHIHWRLSLTDVFSVFLCFCLPHLYMFSTYQQTQPSLNFPFFKNQFPCLLLYLFGLLFSRLCEVKRK